MSADPKSELISTVRLLRDSEIDADNASLRYWLSVPVSERLAAVEQIRSEFHAWRRDHEPRLERVARIVAFP